MEEEKQSDVPTSGQKQDERAMISVSNLTEGDSSIKEEIQRLWRAKDNESRTISGTRTQRSDAQREKDALNWAFERIPVSLFPKVARVYELETEMLLLDALEVLSRHHILSAPVRQSHVPPEASWMERYAGMVDYAAVVLYVLAVADAAAAGLNAGATAAGSAAGGIAVALGLLAVGATGGIAAAGLVGGVAIGGALSAASMASGPCRSGMGVSKFMGGDFFQVVKDSKIIEKAKVGDITGTFRWGPFLPVAGEDTMLTVLLLLSTYRLKGVPVVSAESDMVTNIITQSSIVSMLWECQGMDWFDHVASQSLESLGLPLMSAERMIKVDDDQPVLEPFKRMAQHHVGGVAVVSQGTDKLVANISARDVGFLINHPEHFKDKSDLLVRDLIEAMKDPLGNSDRAHPVVTPPITCRVTDALVDVINRLHFSQIYRLYVVNEDEGLRGVVTLRDIIGKFVYEPYGYFGSFFGDAVLPPTPSTTPILLESTPV